MKALAFLILVLFAGAVVLGHTIKALAVSETEAQTLRGQLSTAQAALSKAQADLQAVTQSLAAVEAERDKLLEANQALFVLVEQLKRDAQALQEENGALRGQVQGLEEHLQTTEARNALGTAQLATLLQHGPYFGAALTPVLLLTGLAWSRYSKRRLVYQTESAPQVCVPEPSPVQALDGTILVHMTRQQARAYARRSQRAGPKPDTCEGI
jgi:septal ring factor EnvC (AmiA/AmiB activator)